MGDGKSLDHTYACHGDGLIPHGDNEAENFLVFRDLRFVEATELGLARGEFDLQAHGMELTSR